MIESLFFGVIGTAVLFTVLTAVDRDEIAWPILAFVVWIVCAVTVSGVERVGAFMGTDGVATEYVITYSGGAFMQLLFTGLAIVFVTIFYHRVLAVYREAARKKVRY